MAYDLGIFIYKDFMNLKNDRIQNASDYILNNQYDQSLRDIVRGTLLNGEEPLGVTEIILLFEQHLRTNGLDIHQEHEWSRSISEFILY